MTTMNYVRMAALLALLFGTAAPAMEADRRDDGHRIPARVRADSVRSYAERFGAPRHLTELIVAEAARQGIEPALAMAVVQLESAFDPSARGRHGEVGLMQVRPFVARAYGPVTVAALARPAVNVRYGLTHLRTEMDHFGDPVLGLVAYNMGRTRVASHLSAGRVPPTGYSRRVLERCGDAC